jgi:DNA-binding LytR/AlgR family response regulator
MKVLIIEDELPAQRILKDIISEIDSNIEIIGCLGSVFLSVTWFRNNKHPDIVFMDIQLSDGTCFNILEKINVESMIVFTTAYDEYALKAFTVNSLDYILKPYDLEDIKRTFIKYNAYSKKFLSELNKTVNYREIVEALNNYKVNYRKRFLVHSGESFYKLEVKDISYFFSSNKISFAVTFDGRTIPLDLSLDKIYEQLDPSLYFRINRQIILSQQSIQKIHSYFSGKLVVGVKPAYKEQIIVGKDKAAEFKKWIDR